VPLVATGCALFHKAFAPPLPHTFSYSSQNQPQNCSIAGELKLCSKFLELDERNFHCWGYRRFVCSVGSIKPQAEFEYTTAKIEQNFSNYSAFHHRSTLLPALAGGAGAGAAEGGAGGGVLELVRAELELVKNAVFTEPDDQSAWVYYHWILAFLQRFGSAGPAGSVRSEAGKDGDAGVKLAASLAAAKIAGGAGASAVAAGRAVAIGAGTTCAVLREELASCSELLEAEGGESKWALLTQAMILGFLANATTLAAVEAAAAEAAAAEAAGEAVGGAAGGGGGGGGGGDAQRFAQEAREAYSQLAVMDPMHAVYYAHARAALAV
jgi:hypothetical protein